MTPAASQRSPRGSRAARALFASVAAAAALPGALGRGPTGLPAVQLPPRRCRAVPRGCGGCATAEGWDEVLEEARAATRRCAMVFYTTVFYPRNVSLVPPIVPPGARKSSPCWLLFSAAHSAAAGRRASRVAKLLGPFFFPGRISVFIDWKLSLQADPARIAMQLLGTGNASLAAFHLPKELSCPRNTELRDLYSQAKRIIKRGRTADAAALQAHAHRAEQDAKGGSTAHIDGALLVWDGRQPAAKDLACKWYREYTTRSDRDQFAFAAVYGRLRAGERSAVRIHPGLGSNCSNRLCHWYCRGLSFASLRSRYYPSVYPSRSRRRR
eukprot:TRINITY_DN18279_c0_g1_i4.p1 TRINITY_DN18279_c0_g1~~TRINITY_DN18279_c0_g1_i4.p1  ORF type:complete len:348 (+),score=50.44 TRINITY_DN18279_c0_g1_i4:69-1046(+)